MLIFIHVKTQPGYSLHVPVPFSVCSGFSQDKEENQEHLKIIKNKVPSHFHSPENPGCILVETIWRERLCIGLWTILSHTALILQQPTILTALVHSNNASFNLISYKLTFSNTFIVVNVYVGIDGDRQIDKYIGRHKCRHSHRYSCIGI